MLSEFVKKYTGVKDVGNTPDNKGECVGLVMVYINEVLGLSHIWGHAKDIFTNAPSTEYEKIQNETSLYPKAGDIVCWNATKGGGFGHIAIVISSDPATDSFKVFEQNNPLNSAPKQTTYKDWSGVIGWLRPKQGASLRDRLIDWSDFEGNSHSVSWYVHEWEVEKKANDKLVKEIANKNTDYERLQKTNSDQTLTITQLQKSNSELNEDKAELEAKNIRLVELNKEAELEYEGHIKSLTESLDSVYRTNEVLKDKIKQGIKAYSRWDLIISFFSRR